MGTEPTTARPAGSDRARLARVFGFEPVSPWGPVVSAGALAVVPWGMWIASGAIALGLTVIVAHENLQIARGLREVEAWGFPVEGYRAWLLAQAPAFDLELRRDVGVDLVAGSLRAVDPSIEVERRGERVVRVHMAPIELPGPEGRPAYRVGDRTRLLEVRDRVLGALHADVGIAAMRMGDARTLAALVAAPKAPTADAAFREQALVAPPDLQSLARAGSTSLAGPPREARGLELRVDRLLFALGLAPTTSKTMTQMILGGGVGVMILAIVTGIGAPIGFAIGAGLGVGGAWLARSGDLQRVVEALEHQLRHVPFPTDGYDDWLLSGRPVLDIEFGERPHDHELAFLERLPVHGGWLTDRVLRLESRPVENPAGEGIGAFWGGDPMLFTQLVHGLLPLHRSRGVVAVRMGGYLDRKGR